MYLFDIVPAKYRNNSEFRVLAVAKSKSKGDSDLDHFISKLTPKEQAGFMDRFDRFCKGGEDALTYAMFHECDSKRKLHQFVFGNYRITCFFDGNKAIICSHGFRKKTQTTPREEQDRTEKLRNAYQAAKLAEQIIFIED